MTRRVRDQKTLDLFSDFEPPEVVERFTPERVRAASLPARIKQAVSETMKDCGQSREDVAAAMSEYLGEKITVNVLDQYASTANTGHNIPAYRLSALFAVTNDRRLLNALLNGSGAIAVDSKFESLINREMAKEKMAQLQRAIDSADARWKSSR